MSGLWVPGLIEETSSSAAVPEYQISAIEGVSVESSLDGGTGFSVERVEDLPLSVVESYADLAVRHAQVTELEGGGWFAAVAGLTGAWGDGESADEAVADLREAIIGWVAVKRRVGADDIPPMAGLDLNLPRHEGG